MKTNTIVVFLLLCGAEIAAQTRNKTITGKPPEEVKSTAVRPNGMENAGRRNIDRFEIVVSASQGKAIAGYNDPRYVADDKSDYLKSNAISGNVDFVINVPFKPGDSAFEQNFKELFTDLDFLRFGGQLTGRTILEGQSIFIPRTNAPINAEEVRRTLPSATQPGFGFFFGVGGPSIVIDLGVNISAPIEYEGSRTRRLIDANGNLLLDASGNALTEQVPGRGGSFGAVVALPTFKLLWGARNNLQFAVSAGRDTFAFHRDYIQTYFRVPIVSFLKLDFGAGLYPTASIFLQPNIEMGPVTVGLRGGISLNYYDSEIKRVSLVDAIYFGGSLSARF